jgi:hypothetical protein
MRIMENKYQNIRTQKRPSYFSKRVVDAYDRVLSRPTTKNTSRRQTATLGVIIVGTGCSCCLEHSSFPCPSA